MTKVFTIFCAFLVGFAVLWSDVSIAEAQSPNVFPGSSMQGSSSDVWRDIKEGAQGNTSLPDKNKGFLIRSLGEQWRTVRNDMVFLYGAIGFAGVTLALLLFYAVRGQIKLDGEMTGRKILRFTSFERIAHWAMAGSFILLAITGLNMLYGRAVLVPLIGHEAFSTIAGAGKFVHNNLAWVFMISLLAVIVMWAKDNLWDRYDLNWILKGGGLFSKNVHPPSAKFNFGEKTMFWMVALGGLFLSATGLFLLFPDMFGTIEWMRLAQISHSIMALALTVAIMGHIYIGSVGMEGAIDSMKSGYVDETWAKEHHSVWAEEQGLEVEHKPEDEEHVAQGGIAE